MKVVQPRDSLGLRLAAGKTGGFDYLRIILAVAVLYWHCWGVIQQGQVPPLAVKIAARGMLPLFFALSGFLVASSLERLKKLPIFLLMRFLRIFPALIVETTLSAIILGIFFTTLPIADYVRSPVFWSYAKNIYGDIHFYLPGVFETHPSTKVNASLWTVPFELECYIALSVLSLTRIFRSTWLMVAALLGLSIYWYFRQPPFNYDASLVVPGRILLLCFLAGNVAFKLRDWLPAGWPAASATLVLSYVLLLDPKTAFLAPPVVAYAAASLGCTAPKRLPVIFEGDYSYGVYLYAYPIQQAVYQLSGTRNVPLLFVLALSATSLFAAFSWHCVEKPTLRLKNYFRRKNEARLPVVDHAQGEIPVTPA